LIHALRKAEAIPNPALAQAMIAFLSRANVHLTDADSAAVVAALHWSTHVSARRIPDAILAAAAESARCDSIASFDEKFDSPSVPVRLL
jgi:predicted nucleic acid-binding protein